MTTRITSSQIFIPATTLHVIFSPSAAVALWIINVARSLGLMLNCPWKAGSNVTAPDGALLPILPVAPIFHATKESTTPSKVKSHSKRNSGDLPSKTLSVVRTEASEASSGPRCGEGRVHVIVASTAQRKWPVKYQGKAHNDMILWITSIVYDPM